MEQEARKQVTARVEAWLEEWRREKTDTDLLDFAEKMRPGNVAGQSRTSLREKLDNSLMSELRDIASPVSHGGPS